MSPQPPAPEKRNGSSAHGRRFAEVAAPSARELEWRQEVVSMLEGYLEQLEQGTAREPEEWLAQHPGLSGPLEEYLATLKLLHREALNLSPGFPLEGVPPKETALGLLGDYQLLRELGRGGMGIVYEAEQLSLRRRVALKVLPLAGVLDRRQLQRFQNEALTASQLHHPHIVDVFGAGCERGVHYYAMRHIEGRTLAQLIAQIRKTSGLEPADGSKGEPESPPPPSAETDPVGRLTTEGTTRSPAYYRAAAEIAVQVAEALDYAHEHGVVHRDIKPSNVLIDIEGQAWVADFGLARLHQQAHLTQSGDLLGTLRYMSREQALAKRGVLDHRTDIYALGATLYELLTLQPAVTGTDRQEILRRIAFEEPARPALLNPAIPLDLEAIVLKAMAKVPEERYTTAHELADDLRRFLNDQPVQARRFSRRHQAAKWARRHRRPLIVIAVGAVLMLALAVILLAVSNFRIREALAARDQALEDLRVQELQTRAAERDKTLQLALGRWNEARLSRQARRPGQRYHSLEALADTVRHLRSLDQLEAKRPELRDDALASLTLWDVRAVKRLSAAPDRFLAVDPLGHHYACADAPNAVSWRRLADNQVVHRWQWERSHCVHIKVSPDGRYVAALCLDDLQPEKGVCHVWDSGTGRLVLEHPASYRCAHDFRPDSKVLALAQADGSIALCDLDSGRDLPPLPTGPMPNSLRFHPSGRYLAVSFHAHHDIKVWDLAAGFLAECFGERYWGASLAWSPDGSLLAVGSTDNNIYICAFRGGKCQAILRGHEHVVIGVEFHPSGRLLASTSHDGTIRLWCFSPGRELVLPGERLLGFSSDGHRLFTKSFQGLTEWELAGPGDGLHYLPHGEGPSRGPWGVAFAPDGRLLASASQDGVLLWDAAAARQVGTPLPSGDGYALTFHPKELCLFTTGSSGWMQWPIVPERDGQALRIGPGTVVRPTTVDSRSLRIDVAGTGESLLLGAGDGGVDLVPLAEPGKVRRLGTHDGLFGVALSPDGRWAASASGGDTVCVWDVARGALVRRLPHGGGYGGATFSPDGRWLVTSFHGSDYCFWEVGSWELKARLPRDPRSLFGSVAFACEGRLLALVDGRNRIHLYDAATLPLRRLATLETPEGPATLVGLSLSPDGTRLAATTDYNVIALWDLRRLRQELAALDLDWDMLPYLPPDDGTHPVPPLDVEVLPTDKAPR